MGEWNDLIRKIYDENKHKSGYKLGNAMKAASPIWAKMKKNNNSSTKKSKTQKGGKKKSRNTKRCR